MRQSRRVVLLGAAAATMAGAPAPADPRKARPAAGDRLVVAEGDRAGEPVRPDDIAADTGLLLAWPMTADGVVRDGAKGNLIVLVRRDPATLDAATRSRAADGVVAFAATCSHAGCAVKMLDPQGLLLCPCHMSRYDPRRGATVVGGPSPRPLPALPLAAADGALLVAGPFTAAVGPQPG